MKNDTTTNQFAESLKKLYDSQNEREPGDLLGFSLNRFPKITEKIDGVQPGLYLIGAETNIGKTNVLINFFLDAIRGGKKGLFVSLDDPAETIINRLTALLMYITAAKKENSGIQLNRIKKRIDNPVVSELKNKAVDELISLAEHERFKVMDIAQIQTGNGLACTVTGLKPDIVMVDALYNLEIEAGVIGREEHILRANLLKKIATDNKLPVFTTAEIRKQTGTGKTKFRDSKNPPTLDDIMETVKFAYNADLVAMLYPKTWNETPLIFDIQKNKLAGFKGKINFIYNPVSAFLKEETGDSISLW